MGIIGLVLVGIGIVAYTHSNWSILIPIGLYWMINFRIPAMG
jgi:hypothetical protein